MEPWTFPDSTILLLCELEGAITERLSPSLKRATGDILSWVMRFAKVVIEQDPELVRRLEADRAEGLVSDEDELAEELYGPATEKLIPGASCVFTLIQEDKTDRFFLRFFGYQVPNYWRLPTKKRLSGRIALTAIRGSDRKTVSSAAAFGEGDTSVILEVDIKVRMPRELSANVLAAIKREAVTSIYHELQHFYQTTPASPVSMHLSPEEKLAYQAAAMSAGDPRGYFLASIEIDAVSTHLYRLAQNQRRTLEDELAHYLAGIARYVAGQIKDLSDFLIEYLEALVNSLKKKYPKTRDKLNIRRIAKKFETEFVKGV